MFGFHFAKPIRAIADERGVTALEYAVIAAGIVLVVATAVQGLSGNITTVFDGVSASLLTN
jgi:pilus assembly protein Flp/PilA